MASCTVLPHLSMDIWLTTEKSSRSQQLLIYLNVSYLCYVDRKIQKTNMKDSTMTMHFIVQ
jgi:hypothetical protein